MAEFFDANENNMIDWLEQEADEVGYNSTLAFLGDYLGADLDDYKWKAVQTLAERIAIEIMESEI